MTGLLFGCWIVTYLVIYAAICVIRRFDGEDWEVGRKAYVVLLFCSGASSVLIVCIPDIDWAYTLLLGIFAGCLFFACMTDCKTCEVFQFTWWVAGGVSCLLLCRSISADFTISGGVGLQTGYRLLSLLFYGGLQEVFFGRMYGRADCHAFVVCAMAECAVGMDMQGYLIHMATAFGSLVLVQAFRHNINRKGNLKHPVAFLPYITISFWGLLGLRSWMFIHA